MSQLFPSRVTTTARPSAEARALIGRASSADVRARAELAAAVDDAMLDPDLRLDDRTRVALTNLVDALIDTVAAAIGDDAAQLASASGEPELADALREAGRDDGMRVVRADAVRDGALIAECVARVRVERIATALPVEAPGSPDTPSLLTRLADSTDRAVASAASSVLAGESHRRAPGEGIVLAGTGLPPALHRQLAWRIAAALRQRVLQSIDDGVAVVDRVLTEAALRNLAAHDDDDRMEIAATRLAVAIDAQPDELPALLDEALRDRRMVLFIALLAHGLGVGYPLARELVLDRAGERLWLALRSLDQGRETIARIGYVLSEADPRRDVEVFADLLDAVMAIDPTTAQRAIAPLKLHPDYRAAIMARDHDA